MLELITRERIVSDVMNITKRFCLGVISTLLLAAGFAHAADRLDPITQSLGASMHRPLMDDPEPPLPQDPGNDSER
jgi:hypothetical protein